MTKWKNNGNSPMWTRKKAMKKGLTLEGAVFSLCVGFVASTLVNGIAGGLHLEANGNALLDAHVSMPAMFLCLALLIPVLEEVLFRGLLLAGILWLLPRRKSAFWLGTWMVSLLFGSLHMGAAGKWFAVAFSALLCVLTRRLGLCAAVLAHIGFNLTAFALGQCDAPGTLALYGWSSLIMVGIPGMRKAREERRGPWPPLTKAQ